MIETVGTSVGPGRRANVGTLGTPDRYPELDTSGQRRWDIGPGPGHQQAHIRWEVIEDEAREDSSVLGADWGRPVAHRHHLQRAVAPLQPCASFLLPSCVASILFGFP